MIHSQIDPGAVFLTRQVILEREPANGHVAAVNKNPTVLPAHQKLPRFWCSTVAGMENQPLFPVGIFHRESGWKTGDRLAVCHQLVALPRTRLPEFWIFTATMFVLHHEHPRRLRKGSEVSRTLRAIKKNASALLGAKHKRMFGRDRKSVV